MRHKIYHDIPLSSGDMHIVHLSPNKDGIIIHKDAKSWCRTNTGGVFGYSRPLRAWVPEKQRMRSRAIKYQSFFAFSDDEDVLAFKLVMDETNTDTLWRSYIKFTIYFPINLLTAE